MQELLFIGGCTLFLAGAMLAGAARIVEVLVHSEASPWTPMDVSPPDGPEHMAVRQESDAEQSARIAEAQRSFDRFLVPAGIALVLLIAAAWFIGSRGPSPEAAAMDANVSAMTNLLEAQAERLDALANEAGASRR